MAEKKKAKQRRRVSKPRLLREIMEQMKDSSLDEGSSCGELVEAIEKAIVYQAVEDS